MIVNTMFKKKKIQKYMYVRMVKGMVIEKALMDYVVISKTVRGRVLDVNVLRGENSGISDHFLVECKIRIDGKLKRKTNGNGRKVIKVNRLYE